MPPINVDVMFRDFQRYTGDGLPNAPAGHPLPIGDPTSGVYNPTKRDFRELGYATLDAVAEAEAAAAAAAASAAVASGTPQYSTRALAQAATVPAYANLILVDGLMYRRDAAGTALTTGGAAKWAPYGEVSVKHFGAVGDGAATDTGAVQAALNHASGGVVYVPPGTYLCGRLTHPSGTTIKGERGLSIIKAAASLATTESLLSNAGAAYIDANMVLDGVTFDGSDLGKNSPTQVRMTALVRYIKATGVTIRNCVFRDFGYILAGLRSCRDVLIQGNEFTKAGYAGATANGGSAIWVTQTDTDYGRNIAILGNHFHDNEWHGSQVGGIGIQIIGNRYINNKETHIFSTVDPTGTFPDRMTRDLIISDNRFAGLRKKDISAHGLEIQTWGGTIANNTIHDCDHGGIAIEKSRDVIVTGNTIRDFGRPSGEAYAGLDVYCTGNGAAATSNIEIANNIVGMSSGAGGNASGIRIINPGGELPVNLSIHDNNLSGATWGAGALVKTAWTVTNCRHWNNRGANDSRPYVGAITVSTGGLLTISGIPFTPQWIEFTAFVSSSSASQWSRSTVVQQVGTVNGMASTVTSTARLSSGLAANVAASVLSAAGVQIALGTLTAFTADGCTINFTTLTEPIILRFTAYP